MVGDAILAGAKAITGLSSGAASAVLGFLFAGIAILTLTAACGLGPAEGRRHEEPEELDEALPARRRKIQDWDEAEEIGHDEPGWGIVSLGALCPHGLMSLRASAAAGRAPAGRFDETTRPHPSRPGAPRASPELRREPVLDGAPGPRPAPSSVPMHDEDEAGWDEDELPPTRPAPIRNRPRRASDRPMLAPKPGKRMAREAQPSLLDEENYQLPQLGLLAEPTAAVGPDDLGRSAAAERRPARRRARGLRRPRRDHQGQSRSGRDALRA